MTGTKGTQRQRPSAIYDLDAPGPNTSVAPRGYIQRVRDNFGEFATITITINNVAIVVRASKLTNYFVDISIHQTDSRQGTNWVRLDDVKGDNQAGYGITALTWDLKKK